MDDGKKYTESFSLAYRRRPLAKKIELVRVVRWVAVVSLFIFLILTISYLLVGFMLNALVTAVGLVPILITLWLLRRGSVTVPSTMLAFTIIVLITILATFGEGLYDIGLLGFPVILIVAGLFLRGRIILYLTFFTIICLGWLAFRAELGVVMPSTGGLGHFQDFFLGAIIMLVAGNSVYRLAKSMYDTLQQTEQEIEARNQVEAQREALIQQLQLKNRELDRFAIRVSHDLKTPLITLAGFLGLLEKDVRAANQERVAKDLMQINEAAKTMGTFVDELLDLSRVGRIVNPPQNVAFDDILQDALKATDGLLKQKQVQVEVAAVFPVVHVDRARVVQTLQNLIVNAVKFMGDQPRPIIKFGIEDVDGEQIFSVSDNGIGIAPENHERIFELFGKLNPDVDGTGLGLGLARKIIEVHQGRIWVESEVGHGATFRFTLGPRLPKIG